MKRKPMTPAEARTFKRACALFLATHPQWSNEELRIRGHVGRQYFGKERRSC